MSNSNYTLGKTYNYMSNDLKLILNFFNYKKLNIKC